MRARGLRGGSGGREGDVLHQRLNPRSRREGTRAVLTLSPRTWNPFQVKSVSLILYEEGRSGLQAWDPLPFPLKDQDQG